MEHMIHLSFDRKHWKNLEIGFYLRKCIKTALSQQKIPAPCEINVMVTDDATICGINRLQRGIDKPTDVLSFPMFELTAGEFPAQWDEYLDPATDLLPLGDMVISLERAKAQAKEFGHSLKREVGYLTVHSILHLLGYDHVDEAEMKKQMRAEEEKIMAELLLGR